MGQGGSAGCPACERRYRCLLTIIPVDRDSQAGQPALPGKESHHVHWRTTAYLARRFADAAPGGEEPAGRARRGGALPAHPHQARRPDGPRLRRQQGAQIGIPRRGCAGTGRDGARHRRGGAIESRPHDGGCGAHRRSESMPRAHRQRPGPRRAGQSPARPAARCRDSFRHAGRGYGRADSGGDGRIARQRRAALPDPCRRLERDWRLRLCDGDARTGDATLPDGRSAEPSLLR